MIVNRLNGHKLYQHLPLQETTKFFQIWDFKPSGNPAKRRKWKENGEKIKKKLLKTFRLSKLLFDSNFATKTLSLDGP
jgi:2-iminoacetate synthase ThiH